MFTDNELPESYPYEVLDDILSSGSKVDLLFELDNILQTYSDETDIYHIFNPQYLPVAGW
jgi:hypothetical protein